MEPQNVIMEKKRDIQFVTVTIFGNPNIETKYNKTCLF